MGTIATTLKVVADAKAAVHGLKPLSASLDGVTKDAEAAEVALKDLDKAHTVKLNDTAIETAKKEISNLRASMRHDLSIDANANTKVAQSKIRALQSTVKTLDAENIDIKASVTTDTGDLDKLKGDLGDVGGGGGGGLAALGLMGGKLAGIAKFAGPVGLAAGAVAGVGLGAYKALKPLIGLASNMENAKIAFTQFLGSGDKADAFLANLQQFAAKTPFEFPELVESSKRLLAFGIDSKDVVSTMTTLGDAAALTGASVDDLATIWGQMSAKGKVSNEELMQLTENGIPAYDALAKSMGKTPAEIQKMAEKGELLSTTTLPKLKKGLDATFGGGMAKEAQTLSGKWSTLKDTITASATDLGKALLPFVSSIVDKLQPALQDLADWVSTHKGEIALAITEGGATALDYGAALIDMWGSVTGSIGHVIEWVGKLTVAIGRAAQGLSDLPGVPDDLGDNTVAAGKAMEGFGKTAQTAGDKMHGAADGVRKAADKFREFGKEMAAGFNTEKLKSKIAATRADIASLSKKPPSPEIDAKIAKAKAKLKNLKADLHDINQTKAAATVDAKIKTAKKKVSDLTGSLLYLTHLKPTPEVKAKTKKAERDLRAAKKHLRELGKQRATIHVDQKGAGKAGKDIDHAARDRTSRITVVRNTSGGTAPGGGVRGFSVVPQSIVPQSIVPQMLGAPAGVRATTARLLATPTGQVALGSSPVAPGAPGATRPAEQTVRLAPRQTPVAVYLDGAVIADHLTARGDRMAASSSIRRTA